MYHGYLRKAEDVWRGGEDPRPDGIYQVGVTEGGTQGMIVWTFSEYKPFVWKGRAVPDCIEDCALTRSVAAGLLRSGMLLANLLLVKWAVVGDMVPACGITAFLVKILLGSNCTWLVSREHGWSASAAETSICIAAQKRTAQWITKIRKAGSPSDSALFWRIASATPLVQVTSYEVTCHFFSGLVLSGGGERYPHHRTWLILCERMEFSENCMSYLAVFTNAWQRSFITNLELLCIDISETKTPVSKISWVQYLNHSRFLVFQCFKTASVPRCSGTCYPVLSRTSMLKWRPK